MSETDTRSARYGRVRVCPHCKTRVAQKAHTCFFCGASLDDTPRLRRNIPWADIILLAVIGTVLVVWWVRTPLTPSGQPSALAQEATADAGLQVAQAELFAPVTAQPMPTDTPAPQHTATPEPTGTPVPTPIRYTVQSGDTVELIAGRFGSTIRDVIEANGLTADGFIRVGQELIVPVAGPMGGPGPTATPAGGTLVYSVQPGDTISTIALRFGSQVDWILKANQLRGTEILSIGQSLLVPLGNQTPTPTPNPTPAVVSWEDVLALEATPNSLLRAPALLMPAEGADLAGSAEILLAWAASGVLAEDQWYVVTLKARGTDQPITQHWTKGTSWRFVPDDLIHSAGPTVLTWQVQVMIGTPGQPDPRPVSPASELRSFSWQ